MTWNEHFRFVLACYILQFSYVPALEPPGSLTTLSDPAGRQCGKLGCKMDGARLNLATLAGHIFVGQASCNSSPKCWHPGFLLSLGKSFGWQGSKGSLLYTQLSNCQRGIASTQIQARASCRALAVPPWFSTRKQSKQLEGLLPIRTFSLGRGVPKGPSDRW